MPETLSKMRAGRDYAKDRLIFLADTREYAETVAAAYSAELVSFSYGVAEIRLTTATVEQALEIAADPENGMPAVDPDCVVKVEPAEETRKASYSPSAFSVQDGADEELCRLSCKDFLPWICSIALRDGSRGRRCRSRPSMKD